MGVANTFISAALPHKNYNPGMFSTVMDCVFSYIKLEEFNMEYYTLLSVLNQMNQIALGLVDYKPYATKEIVKQIVEDNAFDLTINSFVRMKEFLDSEAMDSDLSNGVVREKAAEIIYSRTIELYDNCFVLAQESDSIINSMPLYKSAFLRKAGEDTVKLQGKILVGQIRIGRETYGGSEDWLRYTSLASIEIRNRIDDIDNANNVVSIKSLSDVQKIQEDLRMTFIPVCLWGIPDLDDETPLLRNKLYSIVASAGVGKTMLCIHTVVRVLRAGYRVLFMYSENTEAQVWALIIVNYVWQEYGKFITPDMVKNPDDYGDEVSKVIRMSIMSTMESGNINLREAYHYDNLGEELVADYNRIKFDVLVVDHSLALLEGPRSTKKENIDKLSVCLRNFKRNYPVCVLVTSHPSSEARYYLQRDQDVPKDVPTTRESQTLEAESDMCIILRENETLRLQNLIQIEVHKRRARPITYRITMKKFFDVCGFVYDESLQGGDFQEVLDADQAIASLEAQYGEGDDSLYTL